MDILVVDDEQEFLEMLALRLANQGYRVSRACDGPQALELMALREPEAVILDVNMPGPDGLQVLKIIKEQYPRVEVILLTGHTALDTAMAGLKAGAFDYLVKPANFSELTSKLEEVRKVREEAALRSESFEQIRLRLLRIQVQGR